MTYLRTFFLLLLCLLPAACATLPATVNLPVTGVVSAPGQPEMTPTPPDILKAFENGLNREYLLGPGDVVEVLAPSLPEIAGEQTVSPDGSMTLYPSGEVQVSGKTRTEVEALLKKSLRNYFDAPALTLRIKSFENNLVHVLGRVALPGTVKFRGRPNLLEALSRAGVFSGTAQSRPPSNCAIIRGKDQMLWVSLDEMLRGGSSGRNLDLAGNDIIYIPDADEANVYVLGEVNKPGAFDVGSVKSLLNAVAQAGGPTENAITDSVLLVRNRGADAGKPIKISLDTIVGKADFTENVILAKNDIIFVPRRGIANFNYYLRMVNPFTQLLITGYTLSRI